MKSSEAEAIQQVAVFQEKEKNNFCCEFSQY